MSLTQPDCETSTALLSETSDTVGLRAQRVWRLARVAWFTWLFFTGYFWWRDHTAGMVISLAELVTIYWILERHRAQASYRLVMNLTLAACACGIFSVSISDPALQRTMLFFPVSILFASQLSGVRDAFLWLLVNLAAYALFFVVLHGPANVFSVVHLFRFS